MKKRVLLGAKVLVLMLLTPGVLLALPSIPPGVQIAEPDPSLPKELTAFLGKWEASGGGLAGSMAIIVEKISEEKASLYIYTSDNPRWNRRGANVSKEGEKYKIWFQGLMGINEISLKKDGTLTLSWGGNHPGSAPFKRIP